MERHDVIVVGAGPAGSRAARLLAEHGVRVLLLEKEDLPRYKPCGGGLTGKACAAAGIPLEPLVERWVRGARCRLDDVLSADLCREDGPAVGMVMRDAFDAALAEAAVRAGVLLRDGIKVTGVEEDAREVRVTTTGGLFSASYLVGADGAASVVRKAAGLRVRTNLNPAVEAELHPPDGGIAAPLDRLALYDFGAVPGGYAWIFPKRNHYSVGLCSTYPRVRAVTPLFHAFLQRHPLLRTCRIERQRGWVIPLGTRGGRIATNRCLLAGDAAGCVDPLTGEGIALALESGALAAQVLMDVLERGGPDRPPGSGGSSGLAAYESAVDRKIYADLRLGRWFAKFYYFRPRLSFKVLLKDPRVVNRFFQVMAGERTYRDVLRLMLKYGWRLRLNR
jgi:geranylgeranyl reductase family protein